jgi:long-chain fatty acid transport protein
MVKPYDFLSIGAAFKAPISATIKGDANAPGLTQLGLPGSSNAERSATWPMWFGIGVAIKPNDKFTITADFQYNNWKKLADIPITYDDAGWKAAGLEQASTFELRWENTTDIRFGIEYKVTDSLALRGGFYTDRAPSPEETLNIMLPSIDYKCVTFGLGYNRGKVSVDLAFEYLTGKDREVDPMNYLVGAGMPGTHGMKVLVPNITFTYTF